MNLGLMALLGLLLGTVALGASRESFNEGWRFERFGPQPDGSTRPEPGEAAWAFQVTASSAETDRGNSPDRAMDGDPATRWCAAGGGAGQWLRIAFDRPIPVAGAALEWEFTNRLYEAEVEGSADGQRWQPLSGAPIRHLRVRVTRLADGTWASLREVRPLLAGGAVVENRRIERTLPPSAAAFDDSAWRTLDLPHDWGIEGPFRQDLENNTGKLPWKGIGWYRRHFTVPAAESGRRVFVDFDGAMANAEVWLNGTRVGGWPYGYQGFRVDLTPALRFGAENVLAVRLDTVHWGSRWYPGAGIYRHVWLVKSDPVHIAQWGIRVTTPELTDRRGIARVAVEVENQSGAAVDAVVATEILDPAGRRVASTEPAALHLAAGATSAVAAAATVESPERWDLAAPRRYTARTTVSAGGRAVDVQDTPFGFRTIECTPRDGLKLNGRRVEINGTCNHHDLGPLGAALSIPALHRQLALLKEMGCNALRTTHNPPAPELLELADRMGLLVECEAFDCWRGGKTANDYSRLFDAWHERDLRAMVRHFANHPSVALWSIGNEIQEQHGPGLAKQLADIVRDEDPTRPVTAGCNDAGAGYNGFQTAVDVFGLNYNYGHYPRFAAHPGNERKPIHSSESSSCVSSRGEYFFPVKRGDASRVDFQVSSYDVDAPGWACPPDEEFRALDENRFVLGEFVWTGFDYLGEPTPYNSDASNLLNFTDPAARARMKPELDRLGRLPVPSRSSYFGIIDLAGFPKDRFYLYQARWRPDLPMAHLLPHWTWPERAGQVTPVHCYTSGDEAELFLNGKSLGRKKRGEREYRLRWDDVVYAPGELKVVAYRGGREWATDTVRTAGPAAQLVAQAERSRIRADGRDLAFVRITVADAAGVPVPRAHPPIVFSVEGPGAVVAVCNGDAASFEPFQASGIRAYNGLALAIVKGRAGQAGPLTLRATSPGLRPAAVALSSAP